MGKQKHTQKPSAGERSGDTALAGIDRRLVGEALERRRLGQTLTGPQKTELREWKAAEEERKRWKYYGTIPQIHYRKMSGRPCKVLQEQAIRYDIPCSGPVINLPALLRAFHDLLARYGRKLVVSTGDPLIDDGDSPAKIREQTKYIREMTALARLKRHQQERSLLPRDQVQMLLARVAQILRNAGETFEQAHGPDALTLFNETLADAEREIETFFDDDPDAELTTEGRKPPGSD